MRPIYRTTVQYVKGIDSFIHSDIPGAYIATSSVVSELLVPPVPTEREPLYNYPQVAPCNPRIVYVFRLVGGKQSRELDT